MLETTQNVVQLSLANKKEISISINCEFTVFLWLNQKSAKNNVIHKKFAH